MTFREMRRRFEYLFHRDRFASDLQDEMRLHVELRARKMGSQGAQDADSRALRQFGNRTALQEVSSEMWGWAAWERLAQDVRHAFRSLCKTPAFTVVAVLTLALGLGINTAVFSVVNAVMIRRLPYPEPDRLVSLWGQYLGKVPPGFVSREAKFGGPQRTNLSAAAFLDYRQGTRDFLDVAAFSDTFRNLTGLGKPEQIAGESVTAGFFPLLGVGTVEGRVFLPEDDRQGSATVAILTYPFWQQRLGGDTRVLERTIMLDGQPYRVIGVLPPGFQSPAQLSQTEPIEFYIPAAFLAEDLADYGHRFINVVGRLKPAASVARAQAALDAVTARMEQQHSDIDKNVRTVATPLQDDVVRHVGRSLLALLGASGLIVLITCVNVANLLLVRAIARRHETSVRFALGASRLRVVRQFLAESLLVALAGSGAGVLLGEVLLRLLLSIAPADLPRIQSVSMDWRVFAVSTALATLTGILFGLAPAWQASRTRPAESLKATRQSSGGRAQMRWRMGLTMAEVALSMMLLIGAGLLLKSFVRLMGVDLGFRPEHVLAMYVNLPVAAYGTPEKRLAFFQQLEERVQVLPGVQSAAFANRMPLRGGWSTGVTLERKDDAIYVGTDCQAVSPGYFATVGISLLHGRLMDAGDRSGQPRVALVNQEFARRFLKETDPIGRQVHWGDKAPRVTIVGVVNDVRRAGKDAPIRPELYLSAAQTDLYPVRLADFAVRTAGDPRQLVNTIQAQVWGLDRDQPLTNVKTLDETMGASVSGRWFDTLLLVVFAGVAVGLAVIGVFGVLQYSVSQRMPELGIRIALGAPPGSIHALVLKQAGKMIAVGVACGLGGAHVLTRSLESMLFEVNRNDGLTYLAAAGLLAAVSVAAAMIPARRGAKVDPIVALRYE
jgi:putative ABC transport system permease protein